MKPIYLKNLLKKERKQNDDVIKWKYFGYGLFNCAGENKLSELPYEVRHSKCYDVQNGCYYVDGSL